MIKYISGSIAYVRIHCFLILQASLMFARSIFEKRWFCLEFRWMSKPRRTLNMQLFVSRGRLVTAYPEETNSRANTYKEHNSLVLITNGAQYIDVAVLETMFVCCLGLPYFSLWNIRSDHSASCATLPICSLLHLMVRECSEQQWECSVPIEFNPISG